MNKNAIKKFAIAARTRLIATVSDRAGLLGITKDKISQPKSKGNGFEIYETVAGTESTLNRNQINQRNKLVAQIEARGFDVVMEEVAYTWFNRICAIRFMEVNDYLPTRVRVLSSLREGKNEPDLLTEAPNVDLDFTDKEREWILTAKEQNRLDDLFSMLFIKQCNKLSEILPELFEATEDYTEMLLSLSYTNKDDVVRMLVDGVDEKDFNVTTPDENGNPTGQVEIIGWLYQYYNTELKDDTFAQLKKNVKISKERIPAATQLFTPDWIVRYMVENSVGRIWIEHLRALDPNTDEKATAEKFGWKYYLLEAEQEPDVDVKLSEIRKSYKDLKPEDILCIDPCMGSGHIIVAQFDVLMDIYRSVGYGEREAAFEIVEHNLHGLDIDKRAYQLAYFAVMMKGRQYNRRFFRGKDDVRPQPKVYAFVESNDVNRGHLKYFGEGLSAQEKNNGLNQLGALLDTFRDAREYGSILNVDNYDWELLRRFVSSVVEQDQMTLDAVGLDQTKTTVLNIVDIGEALNKKYDAVVTNPPYMGSDNMSLKLDQKCRAEYENSRYDLYAVLMEKSMGMARAFLAMITQHSWMYLQSYSEFRKIVLSKDIVNMAHLGARAFEDLAGEVVQTTTFIIRNSDIGLYKARYSRLNGIPNAADKEEGFFDAHNMYLSDKKRYQEIPSQNIGYWAPDKMLDAFEKFKMIGDIAQPRQGLASGNNALFFRSWEEIDFSKLAIGMETKEDVWKHQKKYVPVNKGGGYCKWYGNNFEVIKFDEVNYNLLLNSGNHLPSRDKYFLVGITWGKIASSGFSCRYSEQGYVFTDSGMKIVGEPDQLKYIAAFLHSKVAPEYLKIFSETIHYETGNISKLPVAIDEAIKENVIALVSENIRLSKDEWDSYETSWDFKKHPFVESRAAAQTVEKCFTAWNEKKKNRFEIIKANEIKLNQFFIELYGLQNELDSSVDDKDITIRKADLKIDICSFISYAVGCMFGRYSLDTDGIAYAGGNWDNNRYITFIPDKDNIIPITDEEYFEDDIVGLFCGWLKRVFGAETLEENLDFIAKTLGNKGDTSREVIRSYFLNDFFKDHCNTYSVTGSGKRPIYWLFDSGKQNGFKALIYLHRYDQDTVGRVRTDYLHKAQKAIEQAMQSAQYTLDNSRSGTEKSKATKRISKYTKQLAEIRLYDEAIAHIANQRISLDLDDGIKINYAKFQGVEVSREGMKTVKVDLLAKI